MPQERVCWFPDTYRPGRAPLTQLGEPTGGGRSRPPPRVPWSPTRCGYWWWRSRPTTRATARVPTPLHTTPALTMTTRGITWWRIIVRAGVVWSGVGTLAVALTMPHIVGGHFRPSRRAGSVQSREAFQALLSLSALYAVLRR